MLINQIFNGREVSLSDMLQARENRQSFQQQLIAKYSQDTLLSITLNIPGEIKNSVVLEKFFRKQIEQIKELFIEELVDEFISNTFTGNEAFLMINIDPFELKRQLIEFEESLPERRLLDLDVLYSNYGQLVQVNRGDFNLPARQCLICEQDAKICGRNRQHSVGEIRQKITELLCSSNIM